MSRVRILCRTRDIVGGDTEQRVKKKVFVVQILNKHFLLDVHKSRRRSGARSAAFRFSAEREHEPLRETPANTTNFALDPDFVLALTERFPTSLHQGGDFSSGGVGGEEADPNLQTRGSSSSSSTSLSPMLLERSNSTRALPWIQLQIQNEEAGWGFALALYDEVVISAWQRDYYQQYDNPRRSGKKKKEDEEEMDALYGDTGMNEDERKAFETAGILKCSHSGGTARSSKPTLGVVTMFSEGL